ncbi:PREDICTED: cellulose synthase [Prunus dulcis]|uniref:PREDICTED: cellulose synthase n=1 Tax=Prunus dulcis TaxID=3755 RepID=A0A5E4ER61_PRUDU|nr:PREDICTED: cellulose synthase [Prunus dulcis]
MASSQSLPLCEKTPLKINTLQRAQEIAILFLFICLLVYRLLSLTDHGFVWLLAFLCESWFTFNWVLTLIIQWTPVEYKTYPQNLLQQVPELPAVDMFVTTADAELEPPIITVNTVLSLLAVDYPSHKLACYVSDDGCSPLTLYSLTEASKFAQFWVPFCKKYNIQVRAPFRYFSGNSKLPSDNPIGFLQEWTKMKDEYQKLCQKIEVAVQNLATLDFSGDYVDFADIDRRNHPTIIKVIWENKERLSNNGVPHLVYVAREKRSDQSHHHKAGAMNVLTRVSGVMTNAPFMLNVDCDMHANNSKIVLHAMCLLLGFKHEKEGAFVQCPQMFYDTLKDDPFGNQLLLPLKTSWPGFAGMQGPPYAGTGCFQRRKVIYGFSLIDSEGNLRDVALDKERFGNSTELIQSATHTLSEKIDHPHDLSSAVEAANQVAGSSYEHNTLWGTKVGWVYGSVTEDMLTGMKIHARGWKSILCMPDPPGFMGSAPSSSHVIIVKEPALIFFVAVFLMKILYTLRFYLGFGLSIKQWWNHVRMGPSGKIPYVTASLFGVVTLAFKLLGISEVAFEVTQKDQYSSSSDDQEDDVNAGRFTFDESPIFVPATTLLFVHFTALAMGLFGMQPPAHGADGAGLGEMMCCVWVVLCYWPFLKGLFGKGKYGIPMPTIFKSAALALLFMHFCGRIPLPLRR